MPRPIILQWDKIDLNRIVLRGAPVPGKSTTNVYTRTYVDYVNDHGEALPFKIDLGFWKNKKLLESSYNEGQHLFSFSLNPDKENHQAYIDMFADVQERIANLIVENNYLKKLGGTDIEGLIEDFEDDNDEELLKSNFSKQFIRESTPKKPKKKSKFDANNSSTGNENRKVLNLKVKEAPLDKNGNKLYGNNIVTVFFKRDPEEVRKFKQTKILPKRTSLQKSDIIDKRLDIMPCVDVHVYSGEKTSLLVGLRDVEIMSIKDPTLFDLDSDFNSEGFKRNYAEYQKLLSSVNDLNLEDGNITSLDDVDLSD